MIRRLHTLVLVSAALWPNTRAQIPDLLSGYAGNPSGTAYMPVASNKDKVALPQDLDFDPDGNLWVINRGTEHSGGSTVKISNPGKSAQKSLWQQDGNAMHFMLLPTGIAFGDTGNFATSTGALDDNHGGSLANSFSGPSLWTSNPAIYAQEVGGNGSHIDMMHQSPYSLGIAHEKGNAYWVFDANSHDVVRYDFGVPHEPGGDDHSDGIIHRYPEVAVKWINKDLPCHLVVEKGSGWLYIADGGNKRILRLKVSSGKVGGTPKWPKMEQIKEYLNVTGTTWEVVTDKGFTEPVGIDVLGNTLAVSDHANGNIVLLDVSTLPARELGRLATGAKGILGLVIGPDGRIWYVDAVSNQVMVAQPAPAAWVVASHANDAPALEARLRPGRGLSVRARNFDLPNLEARLLDLRGRVVYRKTGFTSEFLELDGPARAGQVLILRDGKSRAGRTVGLDD